MAAAINDAIQMHVCVFTLYAQFKWKSFFNEFIEWKKYVRAFWVINEITIDIKMLVKMQHAVL